MHLVLAKAIGFVPGFAGGIAVFNRRAVHQMLAAASSRYRGPEVIKHMAVEADPFAGGEANDPDPNLFVFRKQRGADAAVIALFFPIELGRDGSRPCRLIGVVG